jgi:hypothetical protein
MKARGVSRRQCSRCGTNKILFYFRIHSTISYTHSHKRQLGHQKVVFRWPSLPAPSGGRSSVMTTVHFWGPTKHFIQKTVLLAGWSPRFDHEHIQNPGIRGANRLLHGIVPTISCGDTFAFDDLWCSQPTARIHFGFDTSTVRIREHIEISVLVRSYQPVDRYRTNDRSCLVSMCVPRLYLLSWWSTQISSPHSQHIWILADRRSQRRHHLTRMEAPPWWNPSLCLEGKLGLRLDIWTWLFTCYPSKLERREGLVLV